MTNAHVVGNAPNREVVVTMWDQKKFVGRVYAVDKMSDIAVIKLNMIHIDDLIVGMVALMQCRNKETYRGYALAGFSFTPLILFEELQKHFPNFTYEYNEHVNPNVAKFAQLWPDSLCREEAHAGINFLAQHGLADTVSDIISAHQGRLG